MHDTIRTNGTPAVVSAGNATTLSSTMTSGRLRPMISRSCGSQYRAPSISACQVGAMNVSSCSMVGLRNSGAVSRMNSFQNAPGSWSAAAPEPAGAGSGGGERWTRSSSKPSAASLPSQDASAANTTRWPRRSRISPTPTQLFVGPYADSGMNRNVIGRSGTGTSRSAGLCLAGCEPTHRTDAGSALG